MKRENYTGEYDAYEVPTQIWENVESHLNQEDKKRRGMLWWRIAAGIILVLGIGSLFTFNTIGDNEKAIAKNTNELVLKLSNIKTIAENNMISESLEPAMKVSELSLPSLDGSIVNGVPFLQIQPNAYTYSWTPSVTVNGSTTAALCSGSYSVLTTDANACSPSFSVSGGSPAVNLSVSGGTPSLMFTSTRSGTSKGLIDGTHIQEYIPTKRTMPYEVLREAGGRDGWMEGESTNSSRYDEFIENTYIKTNAEPVSTFSIDVDGASYSDIRGMINRGELPNKNAIRIEEFVNYFPYNYEEPIGEHPFSMHSEVGVCPWNTEHKLLKIGIKGMSIEKAQLPVNNLVFLLDVSGSMASPEKLELLKKGFRLLVKELREEDRVAICVYAGAAGLVLPPTSGANKDKILDALNNLSAGGSTAGGQGIELAYATAAKNFNKDGNNRVILATDGDFNVGISSDNALVKLIEEKRESGVFLTVLGFGHDNFQSSKMEKLANNGNGNFSFIDNILEAKKVLVTEMGATLKTIAKDVKIQVEFNPQFVSAYRLIGYENRLLQNEDFSNDTIDAGELGAGHTVTALYEIIPANGSGNEKTNTDDGLKYSQVSYESNGKFKDELATMKFRYKEPDGKVSKLIEQTISVQTENASDDFKFIQSVVEFALILRDSEYAGTSNFEAVLKRATESKGNDPYGYRNEFILLVEKARLLRTVN